MRLQRGVFLLYKVYAVQKKQTKKRLKNKPSALTTPQLGEKIKVEKGIKKKTTQKHRSVKTQKCDCNSFPRIIDGHLHPPQ